MGYRAHPEQSAINAAEVDGQARPVIPIVMTREYNSPSDYYDDAAQLVRDGWQIDVVDTACASNPIMAIRRWWQGRRGTATPNIMVTYKRLQPISSSAHTQDASTPPLPPLAEEMDTSNVAQP